MDLEKNFPTEYSSKYSLVTFNEHIGYNHAMLQGRAQDKALLKMVEDKEVSTSIQMSKEELKRILEKVKEQANKILN